MAVLKPPYQYVIDTSALFDLKDQYPERIFPGVWERFNEMCKQKLIVAPREVFREIQKGNDELIVWAENFMQIFLEPCDEESIIIQSILSNYPKEVILKYSIRPWADPLVIGCAKYYNLTIIQQEANDSRQYKIPAIAGKFGIKCQKLVQFFEEENWHFVTG